MQSSKCRPSAEMSMLTSNIEETQLRKCTSPIPKCLYYHQHVTEVEHEEISDPGQWCKETNAHYNFYRSCIHSARTCPGWVDAFIRPRDDHYSGKVEMYVSFLESLYTDVVLLTPCTIDLISCQGTYLLRLAISCIMLSWHDEALFFPTQTYVAHHMVMWIEQGSVISSCLLDSKKIPCC